MSDTTSHAFSQLEINILKTKGLNDQQLQHLITQGIHSKTDFATVGDSQTLADLTGISVEVATAIMHWATGKPAAGSGGAHGGTSNIVIESHDTVYCIHCHAKQPKDYKVGDLCTKCGKQAEPVNTCFWCHSQGPGKFCRDCGAEFVAIGELDLALLLKREGIAKDDIADKLKNMDAEKKQRLWDRVRKM